MHLNELPTMRTKLINRLLVTYGKRMTLSVLKEVLNFSSVGAVVVAFRKGLLSMPITGVGGPESKTVKTEDVANYIANQCVITKANQTNKTKGEGKMN